MEVTGGGTAGTPKTKTALTVNMKRERVCGFCFTRCNQQTPQHSGCFTDINKASKSDFLFLILIREDFRYSPGDGKQGCKGSTISAQCAGMVE